VDQCDIFRVPYVLEKKGSGLRTGIFVLFFLLAADSCLFRAECVDHVQRELPVVFGEVIELFEFAQ